MDCTSCSTQLPLPPPPPSNVPPLLCPPPPPLSSTPPPPLYSTPPPPRCCTRRSSKGRWFKAGVATGSAVSLSSGVTFVAFFIVIYRRYFQQGGDKPPTNSGTNIPGKLTVPLEVTVQISVSDPTVKPKTPPPPPTKPPSPPPPDTIIPCCDSCPSDWTPQRRPCYDSYVHGSWTQPYCVMEVTGPVNVERNIDLAEYMWSKLCY